MTALNRGEFLKVGFLASLACVFPSGSYARQKRSGGKKSGGIPRVIHATDLYHVHCDPDDHWDLATQYALAATGKINLVSILLDYPSKPELGDPDVMGVAQMNYITGLAIPAVVGSPYPMKSRNDIQANASPLELQGINRVIQILREADEPVVIHITGAATHIAVALKREPDLFRKKCKAIYLNAGSANSVTDKKLEYNVKLNPLAFAAIFDAPCPVYWLPCTTRTNIGEVGEYGSYYRFVQGEILPGLSEKVRNFFLFMLEQKKSHEWFSYLHGAVETSLVEAHSKTIRHMWCTAGFLHAAGQTVTPEGEIVSGISAENPLFSFLPVKVSCDDEGYADWEPDPDSKDRFILHVHDVKRYQEALTAALKKTLMQLAGSDPLSR